VLNFEKYGLRVPLGAQYCEAFDEVISVRVNFERIPSVWLLVLNKTRPIPKSTEITAIFFQLKE
jgi:hypothetical protein